MWRVQQKFESSLLIPGVAQTEETEQPKIVDGKGAIEANKVSSKIGFSNDGATKNEVKCLLGLGYEIEYSLGRLRQAKVRKGKTLDGRWWSERLGEDTREELM